MRHFFTAVAVLGLIAAPLAVQAEDITYTESAVASGSLDGVSFTDVLVTVTENADTSGVFFSTSFDAWNNDALSASVTVSGLGTYTLTDTIAAFASPDNAVGLTDISAEADILDTVSTSVGSYDLTTAFGPLTGNSAINDGISFPSSGGAFILTSAGDSTFTAVVSTGATPEPSAILLLGTGMIGLAEAARRRLKV